MDNTVNALSDIISTAEKSIVFKRAAHAVRFLLRHQKAILKRKRKNIDRLISKLIKGETKV